MWNNSYRTPTEHWQKTWDFPKGKKLPTYLGRAKEKRKNRDQRIGMGPAPVKEEKFPHTRKILHWWRQGVAGGKLQSHGGECSNRGVQGKAERFLHRGLVRTVTYQPKRFVCSPSGAGRDWELRLGLRRSDPRERTGVGCMKTAWRELVHHSYLGRSMGKSGTA